MKVKGKRVTPALADRIISAIAGLTECEDFQDYDRASGGKLLTALDGAADAAREVRESAPGPKRL